MKEINDFFIWIDKQIEIANKMSNAADKAGDSGGVEFYTGKALALHAAASKLLSILEDK